METQKIWQQREALESEIVLLQKKLKNTSKLLARILVARGFVLEEEKLEQFLEPSLKSLRDPNSFADMPVAVSRIAKAIENNENIGIFGDYDVDGVCSASLLYEFLAAVGKVPALTLPNRLSEGYGLSIAGIDRLKQADCTLIITADCGVSAHEQIAYANQEGINIIVVDHHTVAGDLPDALAVINPQRSDCLSQAKFMCAAGVAFYLCVAIRRELRMRGFFSEDKKEPDLKLLLDLVALATVCDVVPLIEDNRVLVKHGLSLIRSGKRVGLNALIEVAKVNKQKISSTNLGFHLGPRINAAGRLEDATDALKLMLTNSEEEATHIATMLENTNLLRRELEQVTVEEAIVQIEKEKLSNNPVLVVYNEGWHPGVVGIVASRIVDIFYKPAIIIGEKGKGSGRSISGIDIHAEVAKVKYTLAGFGGHAHAIGVSLLNADVALFRNALVSSMNESVLPDIFQKKLFYDAEVSLKDLNLSLEEELARLEPFGAKNPYPVLRANNCYVRNLRRLAGGHIKGELESRDGAISFIGFRMDMPDNFVNSTIDVLGIIERNNWQCNVSAQLRLIDYKKSLQT